MKVLVALTTGEYIRKANFLPFFLALEKPEGTLTTTIHGQSPAQARNIAARQGLDNGCTHILFVDDDMILPPDTLLRLLSHDKDVVTGLYLMRDYPHYPVIFDKVFEGGMNKYVFLEDHVEGLLPITNCGLGCVLIKTEVFRKLEEPWVRLGEIQKDGWCDDIGFFNRVREAGFELFCDTEVKAGHITSLCVYPNRTNGKWYSEYRHQQGNVLIPQLIPEGPGKNIETDLKSVRDSLKQQVS